MRCAHLFTVLSFTNLVIAYGTFTVNEFPRPPLCTVNDTVACQSRFSHSKTLTTPSYVYENPNITCIPWNETISTSVDISLTLYSRRRLAVNNNSGLTNAIVVRRSAMLKPQSHAFYAERNTGSNLLQIYLRREFFGFGYIGNWKHGCGAPIQSMGGGSKTHVVVLSKSPFSWLTSLYRNHYSTSPAYVKMRNMMSFSAFLRSKFCSRVGVREDRPDMDSDNFLHCSKLRYKPFLHDETIHLNEYTSNIQLENNSYHKFVFDSKYVDYKCRIGDDETFWSPVEMYNLKLRSYIHINTNPDYQHFIRYEDLLIDPLGTLSWLMMRTHHTFAPKRSCFEVMLRNSKGFSQQGKAQTRESFLKTYYFDRSWTSYYRSIQDIEYVNHRLDKEVMKAWQYDLLSTDVALTKSNDNKNNNKEKSFDLKACWRCWSPKEERYQTMLREKEKRKRIAEEKSAKESLLEIVGDYSSSPLLPQSDNKEEGDGGGDGGGGRVRVGEPAAHQLSDQEEDVKSSVYIDKQEVKRLKSQFQLKSRDKIQMRKSGVGSLMSFS
jgi:hypothetical protein